jgi:RNA polymerase sigma factor (sigma-70 family)
VVKPRDVLSEVACRAEAKAKEKRKRGTRLACFYWLIHEELPRQRRLWKQKTPKPAKTSAEAVQVTEKMAATADAEEVPPIEIVARKDLVARLEQDMRNWPRPEREVLELYYVEGLEPEEIAMVTNQPLKRVRENLESIQRRLRNGMLAQKTAA